MAERDRRAGRVEVAMAAVGNATEWPARVVLALASLPEGEANDTRRILEEGLDSWVEEVGLDALDAWPDVADPVHFDEPGRVSETDLDRRIEHDELERAFAGAESQTDEMHSVNDVAERVLMSEYAGIGALAGEDLVPSFEPEDGSEDLLSDVFGLYAAILPEASWETSATTPAAIETGAAPILADGNDRPGTMFEGPSSRSVILATFTRWLQNLEASSVRRAR